MYNDIEIEAIIEEQFIINGGGEETMYDFEASSTTLESRGVSANGYQIYPKNTSDITDANAIKVRAYIENESDTYTINYPLVITNAYAVPNYYIAIFTKSIKESVQGSSATYISGKLHILSPFEVSSVTQMM